MQTVSIPLHSRKHPGHSATLDVDDLELVSPYRWKLHVDAFGNRYAYAHYREGGRLKSVYMHRLIVNAPRGTVVDHENHDTLDNRRENLRICTRSQNGVNRRGAQSNSSSGYLGVHRSYGGRWRATVYVKKKMHVAGYFDDPVEAARARDRLALELYGEFATLNFPDGVVMGS